MQKRNRYTDKLRQTLSLLTCILMIMAVSIMRDGRVWGHDLHAAAGPMPANGAVSKDSCIITRGDGSIEINTSVTGKDIMGYGGQVPLVITVSDGRIKEVKALPNRETPDFFNEAKKLLQAWNGKTLQEAADMNVDAVTGATFSSRAIIANMQCGIKAAMDNDTLAAAHWWDNIDWNPKTIAGLVVVLMAAIVPLVVKNRTYRLCQQVANIIVLGFVCGSFLSYSSLISIMSNGIDLATMLIAIVMMATAFIYPLLGNKSYYCTNVCPFGSLQEVIGRCSQKKLGMSAKWIKNFDKARQVIWALLMLCLWTGLWTGWVDYEPFAAFIAELGFAVKLLALTFLALSTVITRPYCRFLCPTGSLLKYTQSSK